MSRVCRGIAELGDSVKFFIYLNVDLEKLLQLRQYFLS